jgi:superfamily II DNA or RNA helicase
MGDVIDHYLRLAAGKLGVTFATDVKTAEELAEKFNAAGVPAAAVSAATPDLERINLLKQFKNRQILQLVNVDLFGEGFDLPAIEVVVMARPTQSFSLYVQQFGRALRIMPGKERAIIIDHVGNVIRHGLPDAPRLHTLDAPEKRGAAKKPEGIPVRACAECTAIYERVLVKCPFCGYAQPPAFRTGPEAVDGDLIELDPATLADMRKEIEKVDKPAEIYKAELEAKHTPKLGVLANVKRHKSRQAAQSELRETIANWAGIQRAAGIDDRESYKRFFFLFGMDVLTAQTLDAKEANNLNIIIKNKALL